MNATTPDSFDFAVAEGLAFFWCSTHAGATKRFVGMTWQDGGMKVDAEGNPTRDFHGNTIASYHTEKLDRENADHRSQCEIWYSGE